MAKQRQQTGPSGFIVLDKPAGVTSHDMVAKLRWLAGTRKVGHAGTLDPMATGVLVLGLNKATRLLTWVVEERKTYTATIRLGVSTLTEDAEGPVTASAPAGALDRVTREAIEAEISKLTGDIMQVPSAVSAIKVKGVRSYKRVRDGEEVKLDARPIKVYSFDLHSVTPAQVQVRTGALPGLSDQEASGQEQGQEAGKELGPLTDCRVLDCQVTVTCSAGTYIRALARDLGQALGTGAHLTSLRRTAIGQIDLAQAASLEDLIEAKEADRPLPLIPMEEAVARLFPTRTVSQAEARDLAYGRPLAPSEQETTTAALGPDGRLLALLENKRRRGKLQAAPILVFETGEKPS